MVALVCFLLPSGGATWEAWERWGRGGAMMLVALGGLTLIRHARTGRALVVLGLLGGVAVHARGFAGRPDALVLVLGLVTLVVLAGLGPPPTAGRHPPVAVHAFLRAAAAASMVGWFVVVALEENDRDAVWLAFGASGVVVMALATWALRAFGRRRLVGTSAAIVAVVGATLAPSQSGALTALLVPSAAVFLLVPGEQGSWLRDGLSAVFAHPPRMLVVTFLVLSAVGAVLLSLPVASEDGAISVLDAAFTAVSAVCVTGLITLDTPNAFSGFGEATILALIQVGGLGIMTFYTAALAALGRRLSMRHESAIASSLNVRERHELRKTLGRILGFTLVVEGAGAAALTVAFTRHGDPFGAALWRGAFTSISAFCNAGFALQSDSLVPYQSDPFVLHVVAIVIVLGGLSPVAALAVPALARREVVALQTKLILVTTGMLLAVGFVFYGALEWNASLAGLGVGDKLHNAWFQSVTLRTAGFNTVDLTETRPATQTAMIAMMFIGGSPGGTAGGAKTTTFALLAAMVVATMRGRTRVDAFGRRVPDATLYRAAAVLTVGVLSAVGVLILLQLTQVMPLGVAVFETVSALATVGLSIGGTEALDEVGKVLVMVAMFAGRVGPLTLFLFLSEQRRRDELWSYPEEEVDVG